MAEVQRGNAVTGPSRAIDGFADRALGGTPADEQHVALGPVDFRQGDFLGQLLQFGGASRSSPCAVRATGRMPHFIVLQAGDDRVFATVHSRSRRGVLGDAIHG